MSCPPVVVLGDSHARIFAGCSGVTHVERVPGATAFGLANENSVTGAREIFKQLLSDFCGHWVVFNLGEVDCNAAVFRQKRNPVSSDWIVEAVSNYREFLREEACTVRPIVCSVHLPPVDDYRSPLYTDQVNAPRQFVTADKFFRTSLVEFFNNILKTACEEDRIPFLDYTDDIKGSDGLLNMRYSLGPGNSHLEKSKVEQIVCPKLRDIITNKGGKKCA